MGNRIFFLTLFAIELSQVDKCRAQAWFVFNGKLVVFFGQFELVPAAVDQAQIVVDHAVLGGNLQGPLRNLQRFIVLTLLAQQGCQRGQGAGLIGIEPQGELQFSQGRLELSLMNQNICQAIMCGAV